MKIGNNISSFILTAVLLLTSVVFVVYENSAPNAIFVFAGKDTNTCPNQSLTLSTLNATISGDVTDGTWFTYGDGKFMPGNLSSVNFMQAGVTYVPGNTDKAVGTYTLVLVSDDPDGNGPMIEVNDEVKITMQAAPVLICANNLNISLNETCTQIVDVTLLQSNPQLPYSNYIITLFDKEGDTIPNNMLTREHLDMEVSFRIGHQCAPNFCWGKLKVEDYYPPVFVCKNDTILCTKSIVPDSLGYPFPSYAYIDTIINNKYIVKNWDFCSDVTLEYTDVTVKAECARDEDKTVTRKWRATDAKGNLAICNQTIVVKRMGIADVVFPPHFDGTAKPAFECMDTFPILPSGYPSPDTTGTPTVGYCGNLQFNMTDIKFELCGTSYKIVRSWFVIDWCTSESVTRNQIILVHDSIGPVMNCQDTIMIQASAYTCGVEKVLISLPDSIIDCSSYQLAISLRSANGLITLNQYLLNEQGILYFKDLPVGNYRLTYTATDECNNSSTCTTVVSVVDLSIPYPVCDQTTRASIDNNGKARVFATTFDDGSSDNCGIAYFKVRKMVDDCGFGTQFGDYIDFCCSEVGSTRMVALEVTDIHGLKNTCMVEVIIEDKIKPTISCPPNITLECTENYDFAHLDDFGTVVTDPSQIRNITINNAYHQGIVGTDGFASDNCSVTISSSYIDTIHCYRGEIVRTFVATDAYGQSTSCTQVITISNPRPMVAADISWPDHYEGQGCKSSQTDPDITGAPSFINDVCATVAATYEDNAFYIADGACLKIIRTWTVVDWCQFDGSNTTGKWGPYIQVIKLHNTDLPTFTSACVDTTFCSFDANCQVGWVELQHAAYDPCTEVEDLIWRFEIDKDNNGSIDTTGNGGYFEGYLGLGSHAIKWTVEDQCGNNAVCRQVITVVDCKNPSPYCLTSVTLSLMQATNNVTAWARDFDLGSFDNCTDINELWFTFDGALPVVSKINEQHYFTGNGLLSDKIAFDAGNAQVWIPGSKSSGMVFDCQDLEDGVAANIDLEMTVTDEFGNSDFCTVTLVLQDNANVCPDLITHGKISGRIATTNNVIPQNTIVQYTTVVENQAGQSFIDNTTGVYVLDSLPLGQGFIISPALNSDPLDGISTIDLVKIQRHILDLEPFDNPYKLIAADVNSSKSVTASDLTELRKLILGITNKFPKNLDSWVFVPKDYSFDDETNPYNFEKTITRQDIGIESTDNDFIGIKIGDVNESAKGNMLYAPTVSARNSQAFPIGMSYVDSSTRKGIALTALVDVDAFGLQLSLSLRGAKDKILDIANTDSKGFETLDYVLTDNEVRIVGYGPTPMSFKKGDLLAYLPSSEFIDIEQLGLSIDFQNEMYTTDDILDIALRSTATNNWKEKTPFELVNNPVSQELLFNFDNHEAVEGFTIIIYNNDGKQVLSKQFEANSVTKDEFGVNLPGSMTAGIYYIRCIANDYNSTIKFIKIQ